MSLSALLSILQEVAPRDFLPLLLPLAIIVPRIYVAPVENFRLDSHNRAHAICLNSKLSLDGAISQNATHSLQALLHDSRM